VLYSNLGFLLFGWQTKQLEHIEPKIKMRIIILVWAIIFLSSCKEQRGLEVAEVGSKPNIIYIMADDLGYGDVGSYGQQRIRTPNLDKMAIEGMRFKQHYSGSTVCMPSRAVLLTGYHTGHNTVRGNPRWTATGEAVDLKLEDVTVAEELKRAGYETAIIGKWGLAESNMISMPLAQGFDYFYGYRKHKTAHHYYPDTLYQNDNAIVTGNKVEEKIGQYSHDTFADEALDYITRNINNSFFLYLAFTIPHYELEVPEDSKEPYKNLNWEERTLPSRKGGYQHDVDGNVTYAGMVSRMDRDIGRLFEKLKELNLDTNTLVIFTSDNGHQYDNGFFDSNGPFKGKKRDLYEGGIRIPMIARWPGKIKEGSQSEHISAFWDFLPTVCDIAGIEPTEKDIDGISYLPTLLGKKYQKEHDYLYWEFNEAGGPVQAIRKNQWKAVKYLNKKVEIYNLDNDIGEENNLAQELPDLTREMTELLKKARTQNPNFKLEFHPRLKN